MESEAAAPEKRGGMQRVLDGIERVGNKVPHPALIFLALCVIVILLSHILYLTGVSVTTEVAEPPVVSGTVTESGGSDYPTLESPLTGDPSDDYEVHTEQISAESLLTAAGISFIFTTAVQNFNDFGVVAVILVAMLGVGVAEEAGLIAALIRQMVKVAPKRLITFIIVLLGGISSVASDAGYLVLIPLGAAAFVSLGRHPLAGIAAAYAGVSAAFFVNILITPADGIITEVTNEVIGLVAPNFELNVTHNLFFAIAATIFCAIVMTFVTEKILEPRLGKLDPSEAGEAAVDHVLSDEEMALESRGLKFSVYYLLVAVVIIGLLTFIPGAPLRNPETGEIFGTSPFMSSLLFIISILFLAAGLGYGRGSKSLIGSTNVINAIVKTYSGLGGLIFLMLIIAQFIAYFNYTNMAQIAAVGLADLLEQANVGPLPLLIGFIILVAVVDLIMPGVIPKWAILAPIFIPLFYRLGVAPQTVIAAYRVGDGPMNVITPLMVYLPFIVLTCQRYQKKAGMGTVVSMMLPYTGIVLVAWTVFFVIWYLIGIPLGPGSPIHLP